MRLWPALLLLAGCGSGPEIPPGKLVSNNPCVDAILAEVADPDAIGAVSLWSHRASSGSAPLAWARAFPGIGAEAEDIIAARPRIALIGDLGPGDALDRLGIANERFGVADSVAQSIEQVRRVAELAGRPGAGEDLSHRIEAATRPATPPPASGAPSSIEPAAIFWLSGGFVPGEGTLQDELLTRAGFRNASRRYALKRWDVLPMEVLLANPPDVIFTPARQSAGPGMFGRRDALALLGMRTRVVSFPEHLLNCGGPSIIATMQILRRAR